MAEVVIHISADDKKSHKAFQDTIRNIAGIKEETKNTARHTRLFGASFTNAVAGMVSGTAVLAAVQSGFRFAKDAAIGMNAHLETSTLQFETLMGSARLAERHVRALFEFAKRTPFETGPILQASKFLQQFGGEALNNTRTLTLLGDASAATGAGFRDLGLWTARLFGQLQAGKSFGEASQRLTELAVLTPVARAEMERLSAAGGSAQEIFAVFEEQLGQFSGAMEKQADTFAGLMSTMVESLQLFIAESEAGGAVFEGLKDIIRGANNALALFATEGLEHTAELTRQLAEEEAFLVQRHEELIAAGRGLRSSEVRRIEQIREQIAAGKSAVDQLDIQRQGEEAFAFARAEAARVQSAEAGRLRQAEEALRKEQAAAAKTAEKLAEAQRKVEQAWRDSVVEITAYNTGTFMAGDATMTLLGVMENLPPAINGIADDLKRWREDGIVPTTESFAGMMTTLPSVAKNIDLVEQGVKGSTGAFGGLFSALKDGSRKLLDFDSMLSGIATGGLQQLGALATNALVGGIRALFSIGGPSEAELAGRDDFASYRDSVIAGLNEGQLQEAVSAGWANQDDAALFVAIRDDFAQIGRAEGEAEAIWQRLIAAIREGPEAVAGVVAEIEQVRDESEAAREEIAKTTEATEKLRTEVVEGLTAVLDEATLTGELLPRSVEPYLRKMQELGHITLPEVVAIMAELRGETETDWQAMQAAAEKYGIELENLGPSFASARLHDMATVISGDFDILRENGADVGSVLEGMREPVQDLVDEARNAGVEIPANMQPIIDHMINAGMLIDEDGEKLVALSQINFAEPVVDSLREISETLRELVDRITGVTTGLNNIPTDITTRVRFDVDELRLPDVGEAFSIEGFQSGTHGEFRSFGRGTPAVLHGDEAIVPRSGTSELASEIARAMGGVKGGGDGMTVIVVNNEQDLQAQLSGRFTDAQIRELRRLIGGGRIAVPARSVSDQAA